MSLVSPVLRLGLQADGVPVCAVALLLGLVLLPQAAGQLGSHHLTASLLQNCAEGLHLLASQQLRSDRVEWICCVFECVMLRLALSAGLCLGLGGVRGFYGASVAIFDPCPRPAISVH